MLLAATEAGGDAARVLKAAGVSPGGGLPGDAGGARQPAHHRPEPGGEVPGAAAVRPRPHGPGAAGQARPGHRPRRGDPPRDAGALAAHEEQPGAHRRAGRRQDRDRRGARAAHRRRRRPRDAEEQAPGRARHRRARRRREVPRRVRGPAQGRAQGGHRERGRGHPLHRRAAHARRRRRRRGGDGRLEHAQAGAGARRAARDRRDDARRVPQAHREGPGARAALPAGVRRRAERRGHDRDPARPQGALRGPPPGADHRPGDRRGGHALVALHRRPLPARQGDRPDRRGGLAACASRSTRCRPRSTSWSAG